MHSDNHKIRIFFRIRGKGEGGGAVVVYNCLFTLDCFNSIEHEVVEYLDHVRQILFY